MTPFNVHMYKTLRPKTISKKKVWHTLNSSSHQPWQHLSPTGHHTHSASSPFALNGIQKFTAVTTYEMAHTAIPQQLRSPTNHAGCRLRTMSTMRHKLHCCFEIHGLQLCVFHTYCTSTSATRKINPRRATVQRENCFFHRTDEAFIYPHESVRAWFAEAPSLASPTHIYTHCPFLTLIYEYIWKFAFQNFE